MSFVVFTFCLFLNDLENMICYQNCKSVSINDPLAINTMIKLFLLLYADDTIIFSKNERDLQYSPDIFAEYCMRWKLKTTQESLKYLSLDERRENTFNLKGEILAKVKAFKYLGFLFTKNGR